MGVAEVQHRVSSEVFQSQCFKNKCHVMPYLLKMAAAWLSSTTPALLAFKTRLRERPPTKASGARSPFLLHQGPRARLPCNHHPHCRPARREYVRTASQPFPQVPGKTKEWLVSCDRRRGRQGRAEVGKAAVQQAAGHFLGTVTKAHDCGQEDPQDLGWSCLQLPGDSVCASLVPLRHHKPRI